jgi:hypothetical protein
MTSEDLGEVTWPVRIEVLGDHDRSWEPRRQPAEEA